MRVLIAVLALSITNPVYAQSLADEAEVHFDLGFAAYKQGDLEQALTHFMQSNRLAPNKNVARNVAHTYTAMGKYAEAYRWFDVSLRLGAKLEEVQQNKRDIAGKVGLVTVSSSVPGATIYVHRKDLGAVATSPAEIALEPGEYRFVLELEGYETVTTEPLLVEKIGQKFQVDVELKQVLATVQVSSVPAGAEVRVKGRSEVLGTTPAQLKLPPGPVILQISAPGYNREELVVTPDVKEPQTVEASLSVVKGKVEFICSQPGARVEADGELIGYTPLLASLPVGALQFEVSHVGYRPFVGEVQVSGAHQELVEVSLVPSQQVVTGSGVAEDLTDSPASIIVIDQQMIRDRGYQSLAEALHDLPGFDNMLMNGTQYQHSLQRGYRTPFAQRTLILVDGQVDNHLWSHFANLSRQYPMTMIERVEVLYGPASAVYGANAFLGIINVVTKSGKSLALGTTEADLQIGYGSWDSKVVDSTIRGSTEVIDYSISGRYYVSDEDNLAGEWGFVSQEQLTDPAIWGALLQENSYGARFADGYQDPTNDWGLHANIGFAELEIGAILWDRTEGYGPYYSSDAGHPAAQWSYSSTQLFARYNRSYSEKLEFSGGLGWRKNLVYGDWAESYAYSTDTGEARSLSLTSWRSASQSWKWKSSLQWHLAPTMTLVGGLSYEHKLLTKSYDIPGYGFSSVPLAADSSYFFDPSTPLGDFQRGPTPSSEMPSSNLQPTDDIGAFVQFIGDFDRVRLNGGLRIDHNSFYHRGLFDSEAKEILVEDASQPGQSTPLLDIEGKTVTRKPFSLNPRAAVIFDATDHVVLKLTYGEAYQEPAPLQVWGGWNGRAANENLQPEKARNLEFIGMLQTAPVRIQGSLYNAWYSSVIKEEAENAGHRMVTGFDLSMDGNLHNPLADDSEILWFMNYTFSQATSSISYDHEAGEYVVANTTVGDIAPHKANLGVTIPIAGWVRVHTRGNFVSARTPYMRNALRAQDYTFDPYLLWHGMVTFGRDPFTLGLKIHNILDDHALVPGGEAASAGNDFSSSATGFQNSAVPIPGRKFMATANFRF